MKKIHTQFALSLLLLCGTLKAQSGLTWNRLDSACAVLNKSLTKDWSIQRIASRIILTKKDSVHLASACTGYKAADPTQGNLPVKHQLQLLLDFTIADLDLTYNMHRMLNDSIEKIKKSFEKKHYGKGQAFMHMEAIELLEQMKLKDPFRLKRFDLKISDNCAPDWIIYDPRTLKSALITPPTTLQRSIAETKKQVVELLKQCGL